MVVSFSFPLHFKPLVNEFLFFVCLFVFEIRSHYIVQAVLEFTMLPKLAILLPQPPEMLGLQACTIMPKETEFLFQLLFA